MKPSVEEMQRMLDAELSVRSRVAYTMLLLVALAVSGAVGSLWLTEPALPARTQIAFALIVAIGLAWVWYAAWVLTRKRVLLAGHRVIATRMAVAFSVLFVAGSLAVGMHAAAAFGGVMLAIAVAMLLHARRRFTRLTERRRALERSLVIVVLIVMTFGASASDAFVVTETIVRVPESRSAGGTIELAVVRAGRDAKPSRNAHVILAGGPGDSGVNLVRGLVSRGGAEVLGLFDGDLIGIDQRGTGKSAPNLSVNRPYGLPLDRPGSPELWLPLMDRVSREVAAPFSARGIRLEAYNTRESADDVEDVRRALGYERLTLWGRSYGSHLALAVLRRHPKSVELRASRDSHMRTKPAYHSQPCRPKSKTTRSSGTCRPAHSSRATGPSTGCASPVSIPPPASPPSSGRPTTAAGRSRRASPSSPSSAAIATTP